MATLKKIERKNGRVYQIGYSDPITKKFIRKIVRCSQQDAEKIKKKIEAELALGIFGIKHNKNPEYKWNDLKKRYIEFSTKNKSQKTVKRELDVFKAFELFIINNSLIKDITNQTIENYKDYRLSIGIKPATISIELRILKTVFYQGIKWEIVKKNPVRGIKLPKDDIIKIRFLTNSEVDCLLGVIDKENDIEFKELVLAYLHTGARRTELLNPNFTWDNVDFMNKQILLHGKGNKSRYVPMNNTLHQILEKLKNQNQESPFMFKPDFVTHKVKYYLDEAKIVGANCHSLRKTFGCILLQNGLADLFTVSKFLGHSSVKTTEKYYVDLVDDNYRKSVNGLDALMNDDEDMAVRSLTNSEILELFRVIDEENDTEFKNLVVVYLHTGARITELLAPVFTWKNVNLNSAQIHLKSRFVPMDKTVYGIFKNLKKANVSIPFSYSKSSITSKIDYYLTRASIDDANVHSLRKTFGSMLLQNNLADLYTVSKYLGHTSIQTTEKYYSDLITEKYKNSVSGLDDLIK